MKFQLFNYLKLIFLLFFSFNSIAETIIVDANENTQLHVWHYPHRHPNLINPYAKSIYARHMGPNFDYIQPQINVDIVKKLTGSVMPMRGGTTLSSVNSYPTFVVGDGNEFGYYSDTKDMETLGLFPFAVNYCKAVGLGAPQLTLDKNISNQNIFPWQNPTAALELKVELQVPYSEVRVRTQDGQYKNKVDVELNEHAPIFITSSYLYILDIRNNKLFALLFNYYDPRGALPPSLGHDNQVYFYSSPAVEVDDFGNQLSHLFTVKSGEMYKQPFSGFRKMSITINRQQFANLIGQFGANSGLSTDPSDFRLQTAGLLNEMNFHYQTPSKNCIPDYDPQTFAKVGMSFRNFSLTIHNQEPESENYNLYGYYDGVFLDPGNKFLVLGWACGSGKSDPAHVRLSTNGEWLAQILADQNSEVAVNNICQERQKGHRFSYALSAKNIKEQSGKIISVEVRGPDAKNPISLDVSTPYPIRVPQILSGLDGIDSNGLLRGWTCAKNYPQPLQVSVYSNQTKLTTVTANLTGENAIKDLCGASSAHRFEVRLTPAQRSLYYGQTISARVEVNKESAHELQKFQNVNYIIH